MRRRVTVLALCVCVCICVCVSVCYHSSANIARFYALNKVCRGFARFLIRGFSKNPSVQKLWREKGNMQMTMYLSRLVLAGFEYRACIRRYLKAKTV